MDLYDEKSVEKYVKVVLLAGGVLHGANAITGTNLTYRYLGTSASRGFMLLFAISALMVAFDRDFYLPFLGDCVFPTGLLAPKAVPNGADTLVVATVPPNTKVVYWAAEPCHSNCENLVTAFDAYKDYTNSGLATSGHDGIVQMHVKGPQSYTVPYKDLTLKPHVHYRYVRADGMLSKIHTADANI